MIEKVVVTGNGANFRYNFRNTLYEIVEKQNERKKVIEEIIYVEFTNGIAPLIKVLNGINESEINQIINMWKIMNYDYVDYNYERLIYLYEEPLRSRDISKIEVADLYFYENIKKFKNSLGRG